MSGRLYAMCLMLALFSAASPGSNPPAQADQKESGKDAARNDRYGDPLPPGATTRLGTIRFRHAGSVCNIAWAKDQIVSVGDDGWTKHWKADTGKLLSSFRSPIADLPAGATEGLAALSTDGKLAATVVESEDKTDKLLLWDTSSGKMTAEVKGRSLLGQLSQGCLAYSPNGKKLAVADLDGELRLFETATGREVRKIVWKGHRFQRLTFSRSGRLLAGIAEEENGGIALWGVDSGKLVKTIPVPDTRLSAIAFAPDDKTLASGSEEGQIRLWEVDTGKVRQSFRDENRETPLRYLFLEFSPDGRHLAIGDVYNTNILLWNPSTGKVVREIEEVNGPRCAAFSADGKTLATGDSGHLIRLWNVETGEEKSPYGGPDIVTNPIALSPDGRSLATFSPGAVQLWSFPEGKRGLRFDHDSRPHCMAFDPRGGLLVTGSADGYLRMFDPKTGQEKRKIFAHRYIEGGRTEAMPVAAVAFSPDGKRIASGGCDSTVRVWDTETGKELHVWKDRKGWVFCVSFSPDGKKVAAGGCSDISMATCLWDVPSGKLVRTLENPAMALAFSRKGDELVTAGGLFGAWWVAFADLKTGKNLARFEVPDRASGDEFHAAAVSRDGRILALGSDRGIGLWDMAARKQLRRIEGDFGSCQDLAFAPDGKTLIAAHGNGTVLFWDVTKQVPKRRP